MARAIVTILLGHLEHKHNKILWIDIRIDIKRDGNEAEPFVL